MTEVRIRKASPPDAGAICAVLASVTGERIHSAIDQPWTIEEQAAYIASLSEREAFHVAEHPEAGVIGFQVLDLWSRQLASMSHVGQLGTFLLPEWRGRGIGSRLWRSTRAYAVEAGYRKLVIQVRASNTAAQSYYEGLGFQPCGRLKQQVMIDGAADDEVLFELFL